MVLVYLRTFGGTERNGEVGASASCGKLSERPMHSQLVRN